MEKDEKGRGRVVGKQASAGVLIENTVATALAANTNRRPRYIRMYKVYIVCSVAMAVYVSMYSVPRESSFHPRRKGSFAAKNHTHAVVPFGREIFTYGIARRNTLASGVGSSA